MIPIQAHHTAYHEKYPSKLLLFREKSQHSYSLPGFGNISFDVASKRQFGVQYDSKVFLLLNIFYWDFIEAYRWVTYWTSLS